MCEFIFIELKFDQLHQNKNDRMSQCFYKVTNYKAAV